MLSTKVILKTSIMIMKEATLWLTHVQLVAQDGGTVGCWEATTTPAATMIDTIRRSSPMPTIQ